MLYDRLDGGRKRAHSTRQSRLSASQVADPHRVATQRHSQSLCHPGFISSLDLTSFVTFPPGAIFFSCLGSILLRFNFSGSFFQFLTFGSFFLANLFPMPYPSLVGGCPNLVHLDLSDCVMLKNDCFPEFYQLNYLQHLSLSRCYDIIPETLLELGEIPTLKTLQSLESYQMVPFNS